jgi:tetratricopeptide (TPR) repeat protein
MRCFYYSVIFLFVLSFSVAQAQTSGTAASYIDRGNSFYAKGDFDRAIVDYGVAITFNPGWALAYYNRGLARFSKRDLD